MRCHNVQLAVLQQVRKRYEGIYLLVWLNAQSLSSVHVQGACSLSIAIAFRTIFLPITGSAVDLIIMNSHCCAIQVLSAYH